MGCSYYKSLFAVEDVDSLVTDIKQFATDTLDVYKSAVEPSCFMCCVYRLFTLNVTDEQLRRITDNPECVIARCVGLLYIRYVAPPEMLLQQFEDFLLDDEELPDLSEGQMAQPFTIGEYVEGLLLKDKYFNTPLPRIPAGCRRKLEEDLAPMFQYRKRSAANKREFGGLTREAAPLLVEVNDGGSWRGGKAIEIVRRVSSRLMVRVQLDDGPEEVVHIGKVVLREPEQPGRGRSRSRSRGRQQRGDSPDWSRHRGKPDAQLVEELRERSRADAVCSDRRGYAKRLPRFEAGLACNREKGREEARLIEDETFIVPGMRRRGYDTEDPHEDYEIRRITEAEEERKRLKRDIYEKYGQQKKSDTPAGDNNDIQEPDYMRLG